MKEEAQEKWFLTLPFTTAVSSAVKYMLHMDSSDTSHHEDTPATTRRQMEGRDRIIDVINEGINPFTTTNKDPMNISTGEIASKDVVGSQLDAKEIGTKSLCNYLSGAHQTVDNIKLKTFASMHKKKKTKSQVVQVKDKY